MEENPVHWVYQLRALWLKGQVDEEMREHVKALLVRSTRNRGTLIDYDALFGSETGE